MKVRWTPGATRALLEIQMRIAEDNPTAAQAFSRRARDYTRNTLSAHPQSGRPGRVEGTRESVIHPSYILVYRVKGEVIEILTIRHSARRWPSKFES
jgi:toxin ParE1/3/4